MHFDVHDKRIIIKSRHPMENEFVMYKSVLIQDDFIKHLLNYVLSLYLNTLIAITILASAPAA